MRFFSPTMTGYLANPDSFRSEVMILISARDRGTGVVETAGFWTGDRHRQFTIQGVSRIFYGAGALLEVPSILYETGLGVSTFDIEFSPLTPEFIQVARVYDVRQQPITVYQGFFDTHSEQLIEEPTRVYKGRSDRLTFTDAEEGESSTATLTIVSSARALTRTITAKHSDETMRSRSDDRIGRYATIAGAVPIPWGRSA
jgi:hypothetical protein